MSEVEWAKVDRSKVSRVTEILLRSVFMLAWTLRKYEAWDIFRDPRTDDWILSGEFKTSKETDSM